MKMPEIPEPAARLADGLPVFSESQMLRFAKQYGRDLLEAAAALFPQPHMEYFGREIQDEIIKLKETL